MDEEEKRKEGEKKMGEMELAICLQETNALASLLT